MPRMPPGQGAQHGLGLRDRRECGVSGASIRCVVREEWGGDEVEGRAHRALCTME